MQKGLYILAFPYFQAFKLKFDYLMFLTDHLATSSISSTLGVQFQDGTLWAEGYHQVATGI